MRSIKYFEIFFLPTLSYGTGLVILVPRKIDIYPMIFILIISVLIVKICDSDLEIYISASVTRSK